MTDLTPNHPAVEAASKAWAESHPSVAATWAEVSDRLQGITRARMAAALAAALPDLTADDLRNTPAGKQLMAEVWDTAVLTAQELSGITRVHAFQANPYREGDA